MRGRKYIMVDEWGPLDPTESAVFPKRVVAWEECAFHVLGPTGDYEITELAGEVTLEKGPKTLRVRPTASGATLFTAKVRVGGKEFPIEGTVLRAEWNVRFWKWQTDPREDADAWTKLLATQPLHELKTGKLDFRWQHEAPAKKVPGDGFATRAVTKMKLPKGIYELRTVSDDGVRVLIDGKPVLENWTWHGPTENKAVYETTGKVHEIVIEHFELDGWARLSFDLRPLP
ncbi:MAG: PA14 domain-containing protein [Planctomycetota bacterium]|nr:PA14 domain-containing protein [Planctomycetota bacterium]